MKKPFKVALAKIKNWAPLRELVSKADGQLGLIAGDRNSGYSSSCKVPGVLATSLGPTMQARSGLRLL